MADEAQAKEAARSTETAVGDTTDWSAAVKRIRDTSDWIVKGFIALSAVLLGTTPLLAHLQGIEFNDRGIIAAVGVFAALGGAMGIAWVASNINLTEITEPNQLAVPSSVQNDAVKRGALTRVKTSVEQDEQTRSLYLSGEASIVDLLGARDRNVRALRSQSTALYRLTPTVRTANAADTPNPDWIEVQSYITQSRDNIAQYERQLTWLADWATFETIRDRFKRGRVVMVVLGAVAFVGICTWVLALGADLGGESDDGAGAAAGPKIGVLTWTRAGSATPSPNQVAALELRNQLTMAGATMADPECDTVGVMIEGGAGSPEDPWQVSVLPRDPCPVNLRFAVDRRLATVAPVGPQDVPAVNVAIASDDLSEGAWLALALLVIGVGLGWEVRRRTSTRS